MSKHIDNKEDSASVERNDKGLAQDEQIKKLQRELIIEKDLTKILLKKQKEWTSLIESLNPTIEALGKKIKTLQNDLHIKNQELTNILQSLSGGLIVTDLNGSIRTFNRAANAITGVSTEQATGKNINEVLGWSVLPDLGEATAFDLIGKGYQQEFEFIGPDNRKIMIDTNTTIMESDQAEKQGILINLNDITQLKRLQEEAERKSRLTAMGEIAMQVAHEIRNPLGSIELFLSMIKMDMDEESNEYELIQHIGAATNSMNHIISNLLEYTRPRPVILTDIDAKELLSEFLDFIKFPAEQLAIETSLELSGEEMSIRGNVELLKQVFHNLFVNACQAMPEGGYFRISTESYLESDNLILQRFQSKSMTNLKELPVLKILFEDTGKGMTEDIKKRIFDPFYTTREQGTGLGLSIVHKTMTAHGGVIMVESDVDKGTKISLYFPLIKTDFEED